MSTNKSCRETTKLFALTRTFCDKPGKEPSDISVDVKSEEAKIIAEIHENYKSEVLVKLPSDDNAATGEASESGGELVEKYSVKFDTRLDHFRRTGFIASPSLINVPDEPKINPVIDTAIDIIKGELFRKYIYYHKNNFISRYNRISLDAERNIHREL